MIFQIGEVVEVTDNFWLNVRSTSGVRLNITAWTGADSRDLDIGEKGIIVYNGNVIIEVHWISGGRTNFSTNGIHAYLRVIS